jgi:hypothetical protein
MSKEDARDDVASTVHGTKIGETVDCDVVMLKEGISIADFFQPGYKNSESVVSEKMQRMVIELLRDGTVFEAEFILAGIVGNITIMLEHGTSEGNGKIFFDNVGNRAGEMIANNMDEAHQIISGLDNVH